MIVKEFLNNKIVLNILLSLNKNGFEAYLVGGAVRDYLFNREPTDFDITTNATPSEIKKVFLGKKIIDTGIKFGTVTVIENNIAFQITTFRIDENYLDNRHPMEVNFSKNLVDDLKRRDFTINAMAINFEGELFDFFGGKDDLSSGIIKCVGEPQIRFEEDALRILRALRFSSQFGFKIEKNTQNAMFYCANLIKNLSSERIFAELSKIICGDYAKDVLINYVDIFGVFMPELLPMKNFEQHTIHHIYDVWTHTVVALCSVRKDLTLRLTMLFHDSGKPKTFFLDENGNGHFYGHAKESLVIAKNILKRLKVDNFMTKNILTLIENHDIKIEPTKVDVKLALNKFGKEIFDKLIEVEIADNLAQAPMHSQHLERFDELKNIEKEIIDNNECYSLKTLAVSGNDIELLGEKGKNIGIILQKCLNEVILENIKNKREDLLNFVRKIIAQLN